jgi:superfamily II DNA or RNA helicase
VGLDKARIFERRMVKLAPATWKKYDECQSGLFENQIVKFAGQWWNMMRRFCSGQEKEKELLALLTGELKRQKVVIWCDYVEEVERISTLLGCPFVHGSVLPKDREDIKNAFLYEGSGINYLVAQPQCWKWGTNLTGCDTVIFFSLPQSLMTWQQVCERTVDLSSNNSLLIVSLLAEDTIEEDILEGLYAKEDREKMVERFRRRLAHQ